MSFQVRTINPADSAAILKINAECTPHVARLDEQELRRLVALASVAWVAQSDKQVVGYLLAMANSDHYDGEEFGRFREQFQQPFVYVDQVAVAAGALRDGIASRLYEHLRLWCVAHDIDILCCEVNTKPLNTTSMKFHERLGFQRLDELETSDGRRVVLLYRLG